MRISFKILALSRIFCFVFENDPRLRHSSATYLGTYRLYSNAVESFLSLFESNGLLDPMLPQQPAAPRLGCPELVFSTLALHHVRRSACHKVKEPCPCSMTMLYSIVFIGLTALTAPFLVPTTAVEPARTRPVHPAPCTVNSVASAANLTACAVVLIQGFTVPSGETLTIAAAPGATVTMTGDITFAQTNASGPLITFQTNEIQFNGKNHKIDGNGALYWDGLGTNGGVPKPHPFVKFKGSGTFEDVTVLNSPAQAVSVGTTGPTTIRSIMVNNSAGNIGSLGHNTDGFDISASKLTISNCVVNNQDDCIAINAGTGISVQRMTCIGSHGISIGSIATNHSVSDVLVARNTIIGGLYGLRIKVDAVATNASVSNVRYEANTVSGITKFGVLISQSYPSDDATPGTEAPISAISFLGGTTHVFVEENAFTLAVDCGACSGLWPFIGLHAIGGKGSNITSDRALIIGGIY
ncbi:pectin lyase fold/virulence factor [Mycena crocata]|nr:pectin lyase fold/virulence factor [Mycena crocata]